jgi:hypothetical protein
MDVQEIMDLYEGVTRFISLWTGCSARSCEHDNEFSSSIKDEQFLDQPNKLASEEQLSSMQLVSQQTP